MKFFRSNFKLKGITRLTLTLVLLSMLTILSSCGDDDNGDDPQESRDIVDVAIANGYTRLAEALTEADLVSTLKGTGPFTVFAPTNAAFEAVGITSENNFGGLTTAGLVDLLTYHVIDGDVTSDELTTGEVASLEGANLSIDATNLTVNEVSIIEPFDVDASNGTIHTIQSVLSVPQDIVELAQSQSSLSTLVEALTKFPDLVAALSDEDQTYTVFAPTNDAFIALLGVIGQTSLDDIPESVIRRILEYHVVQGSAVLSSQLMDGDEVDPILADMGDIISVGVGTSVTVDSATVTTADVEATNGVVHIIDGVLIPDLETSIVNTVVEPAYFSVDFEILTSAVVKADLLTTLINRDAEYTLFAPTDEAFEAVNITSVENLTADDLEPILLYHVLDIEVKEADLPESGSAVTTLNGDFYLSINSAGTFINGLSQVTIPDIDQDNGVVHVIDRTLTPAAGDVVDIAVAASQATEGAEFGQLVAALTAVSENTTTDLITALKGDGPFTVFAPTDAAFQTLYTAVGDQDVDLDTDIDDLVAAAGLETIAVVLQYHVLSVDGFDGGVFSSDIPNVLNGNNSVTLTPLAGGTWNLNADLTITPTDAVLMLGLDDASIIGTDILATNGVIHTIDQVILP
ncbi:MAG: fasciclin domain-containing protein [Bacteroidota bacterium]